MEDVQLQMQQPWLLEKTYHRPQHSDSAATTPDLDDSDRIRLQPSSPSALPDLDSSEVMLQDRYLSSEEDLSPTDAESGDNFDDIEDEEPVIMDASAVPTTPIAASAGPKPCNLATAVSYVSAGRAKVVDVAELATIRERTYSVPAVANAVPILRSPVPRMSRLSFSEHRQPVSADRASFLHTQNSPKLMTIERNRRKSSAPSALRPPLTRSPLSYDAASAPPIPLTPSTGSLRSQVRINRHYSMATPPSHMLDNNRPKLQRSTTDFRSQLTPTPELSPSRSPSPAVTESELEVLTPPSPIAETTARPSSARSSYSQISRSKRASTIHARQRSGSMQLPRSNLSSSPTAPPMPLGAPAFLNSDPFAKKESPKKEEDSSKPAHRRLRSISRTLSLAKIAVLPQGKRGNKNKSKSIIGKDSFDILSPISPMTNPAGVSAPSPMMPPTPMTPGSPSTPASSTMYSPRSSSRMSESSRSGSIGESYYPRPSTANRIKMEARGAAERAPVFELPPFPDDSEYQYPPRRRLTKRRSMLGVA
ncbi:uncharacterized protein K452DRAFT_53573 [Aplosporella prunicola CBS 121167]|uniref:Uncharacterized protein n=1 Tax=Aplosporella prunicola CBS 121167 TaxID=1176127 RepID=A0A6A6BAG6_9PEZI|nr:uncharacterized protein K452DRAFT_53573 [Aplosporella prunicola CBS 121167]KAF2140265.1 hypothetical protein K452DRAFT_53573 [Aplosporella prunicola CBS 121167]